MAINLATQYPGRVTAADANYTYGSSKNETAPGAGDGTPYELARANDIFGFQQALLRSAGIVPNGNAETQLVSEYLQAVVELAAGRAVNYDESGIVNVYVADVRTNQHGPRSYFDGLEVEFTPGNANTGPSSINVDGLGVKNIFFNGSALVGGELTFKSKLIFDLGNDRFNIEPESNIITVAGYTRTVAQYIESNGANLTSFLIGAAIGTAFESVGPTGSGATNIWTALNDLPQQAKKVKVRLLTSIQGSTSGDSYSVRIRARQTGSGIGPGGNSLVIGSAGFINQSGSNEDDVAISELDIPLDSSLRFDIDRNLTGTIPADAVTMTLIGFSV